MHHFVVPKQLTAAEMKEKRISLGLTQKEFAELIGVSKPTIERWEVSPSPITGPVVLLVKLLTPEMVADWSIPEKTVPLRLWYMYREDICTLIDVDEINRKIFIRNFAENVQFRAFGVNSNPSFEDYEEFLRSRCFPETRDGMKLILRDLNLPFYDPLMIVEKTQGRMAEDDFWIRIEE